MNNENETGGRKSKRSRLQRFELTFATPKDFRDFKSTALAIGAEVASDGSCVSIEPKRVHWLRDAARVCQALRMERVS